MPECAHAILSTFLNLCVVVGTGLPSGFLVEGPDIPTAVVVESTTCSVLPVATYLGGVLGGCYDIPGGPGQTNHLYAVDLDPMPGECLYITFFR